MCGLISKAALRRTLARLKRDMDVQQLLVATSDDGVRDRAMLLVKLVYSDQSCGALCSSAHPVAPLYWPVMGQPLELS